LRNDNEDAIVKAGADALEQSREIGLTARHAKTADTAVSGMMKALGDPQRIAILRLVHSAELPAGEIANHFRTSRQAVSQSLKVLANAGLIELRQQGTRRLYRIRPEAFADIRSFLDAFWDDRLNRLKSEIEARRPRHG
jgi:DNA-binding transcriptional ArsR family regulator